MIIPLVSEEDVPSPPTVELVAASLSEEVVPISTPDQNVVATPSAYLVESAIADDAIVPDFAVQQILPRSTTKVILTRPSCDTALSLRAVFGTSSAVEPISALHSGDEISAPAPAGDVVSLQRQDLVASPQSLDYVVARSASQDLTILTTNDCRRLTHA